MTDKEKIMKFLDYKGISKNKFYTQTGLSVGFLDSGNSLGVDKLKIIIDNYHDFNLEWFIYGRGEIVKNEYVEKNNSNISIAKDDGVGYGENYWKGRYDELYEQHEKLKKELNDIKSASASKGDDESRLA